MPIDISNIERSDSYKASHWLQTPPGTTLISSYWESRGGVFRELIPFGLQYVVKAFLLTPVTHADIDEAKDLFGLHFGNLDFFNEDGWRLLVEEHGGLFPLTIRSVPEGTPVPQKQALLSVENTDPRFAWCTNYVETMLSRLWYPTTVATQSREMKRTILQALEESGDPSGLPFKLHDFGARGVSCAEQAALGGAAHLVNFLGTDTLEALRFCREYYHEPCAGFSIAAAEHSTITSWGREREFQAYRHLIRTFGNQTLYAVVSDSYDVYNAVERGWGKELKADVLSAAGTLIIRPDSGNPLTVLPRLLDALDVAFGSTMNAKGFKVLNPKVRLIQGDGIERATLSDILWAVTAHGYSADNLAFGSGGGLLQKVDRDVNKFAIKCSYTENDFGSIDVSKSPVDQPDKASKSGRLELVRRRRTGRWQYATVRAGSMPYGFEPVFREVYRDGQLLVDDTLAQIRERAALTSSDQRCESVDV